MAFFAVIFLLFLLVFLAMIVVSAIGLWKIFEKAGYEGWKAIIPVYNLVVLLEIVGKPTWWAFLILTNLLPLILKYTLGVDPIMLMLLNLVTTAISTTLTVWMYNMLSKSFGKDEAYTVGLFFVPFVMLPILGYSKSQYLGPYGDPARFAEYQSNRGEGFDFEQDKLA